jgi:hypothetical protein
MSPREAARKRMERYQISAPREFHLAEREELLRLECNARAERPWTRISFRDRVARRTAAREAAWEAIYMVRGAMLSASSKVRWFTRCEDAAEVDRQIHQIVERLGEAREALSEIEKAMRAYRDTWK